MDIKGILKKLISITTLAAVIVIIEVGLLIYGFYSLNNNIEENKTHIKDNDITKQSIESQTKTLEDTNYFIQNNKVLKDNFPAESDVEKIVAEVEEIRSKSHVIDLDLVSEEGVTIDKKTLFVKSHEVKDYKNNLKNIDQLRLTIVTKGDYNSTMDMIKRLENSSYLNSIYQLRVTKEDISDNSIVGSDPYEYIKAEYGIIFYYQNNGD